MNTKGRKAIKIFRYEYTNCFLYHKRRDEYQLIMVSGYRQRKFIIYHPDIIQNKKSYELLLYLFFKFGFLLFFLLQIFLRELFYLPKVFPCFGSLVIL